MESPATRMQQDGERPRAVLESELEQALADHLPGLEIADRNLELGASGRRADLVAVDRSGRAVLILLVDGNAPETALVALEALAFTRANATLLARHLGTRGTGEARAVGVARGARGGRAADASVLVVLVAESFAGALLETLAVIAAEDLRLFVVRELKSAGAARSYLLPVVPGANARPAAATIEGFVGGLGPNVRPTAELAIRRIERIDPDLVREVGEATVRWRAGVPVLCALVRVRGELEGSVGASAGTSPIASRGDLEAFLDRVVREYLRLSAAEPEAGSATGGLSGSTSAPLLTPEEIAAFSE